MIKPFFTDRLLCVFMIMLIFSTTTTANTGLQIGAGIQDITSSVIGHQMMGHVKETQITEGIHTRLRSRAFVIKSRRTGKKIAFVSTDLAMIFRSIKSSVIDKLQELTGGMEFTQDNVMLTATHTHASLAGLSHNHMFNLFYGYSEEDLDLIAEGIAKSIFLADQNLEDGEIFYTEGELLGANVNRSLKAHNLNPEAKKEKYPVDKMMQQLNLVTADTNVGVINWFAVHNTSMSNNNKLISGDNKGHAAQRFEMEMGTIYHHDKTFVAGFANSNSGDVSPYPNHWSDSSGKYSDIDLTANVGDKQFAKALELWNQSGELLEDQVDYRYMEVKMPGLEVAGV